MKATTAGMAFIVFMLLFPPLASGAIVFRPFGPFGEGGSTNGQSFTFGTTGEVFEIDSFLNISGLDLNGGVLGTSGQLSLDPLPAGLNFSFNPILSADGTDLTLRYRFTNVSGGAFSDVQFFSFVDAEIDTANNTFFNEAGEVLGTIGAGVGDPDPDSFEIDEPGFIFGDIFDNLLLGGLDNTNGVSSTFPDDVSLALGFNLGTLRHQDQATIDILFSDDGDRIGSFALRHFDTDLTSLDTVTLSGAAEVTAVPEPSSIVLFGTCMFGVLFHHRVRQKRKTRNPNCTP